ncbi:hypothetical protein D918_02865 [Trichuris suis]|nr:hypothetical protein D918_02865 [Trichuris suis]
MGSWQGMRCAQHPLSVLSGQHNHSGYRASRRFLCKSAVEADYGGQKRCSKDRLVTLYTLRHGYVEYDSFQFEVGHSLCTNTRLRRI